MKSLSGQFADWVSTKPAGEKYDYYCDMCAFGSFLHERGIWPVTMYGNGWNEGETGCDTNPAHSFTPQFAAALEDYPHTFGALADRLANLGQSV